jgi:hypothetical protein
MTYTSQTSIPSLLPAIEQLLRGACLRRRRVFETEPTTHLLRRLGMIASLLVWTDPDGIGHRPKSRIPHRYQSPPHALSPQFGRRCVRFV